MKSKRPHPISQSKAAPEPTTAQAAPGPEAPEPNPTAARHGYVSSPLAFVAPSWDGFKLNAKPYLAFVGLYLALGVVIFLVMINVGLIFHSVPVLLAVGLILAILLTFIGGVKLAPGVLRLQLAMARGQTMSFKDALSTPTRTGWRLMGASALVGLVIVFGLLALIVPGILFAIWFSQTPYLVVDKGLGIRQAMGRSRELVRHRSWDVIGMYGLVQSVGLLAFIPIVGRLLSIGCSIVLAPALAMRYDQLVQLKKHSDGSDIPTHPANYLMAALAVVATGISANQSLTSLQGTMTPGPVEKTPQPY